MNAAGAVPKALLEAVKKVEVTGKPVQFFPVQSNAAQLEAMRAGRLHVAGFNTGSNPLAVNCAGFVPFAMMASNNGAFGYPSVKKVSGDYPEAMWALAGTDLPFLRGTAAPPTF